MQSILSVDISSDTARATIVQITVNAGSGSSLEIIEENSAPTGGLFSRDSLRLGVEHKLREEVLIDAAADSTNAEAISSNIVESSSSDRPLSRGGRFLRELLSSLKTEWTSAVLVVPAFDYVSLNLELPFRDSKSIARVVDLEVQDLVPFDVSDFLVQHQLIAPVGDDGSHSDVHVGMWPKLFMRSVIAQCKEAGFEPFIVTTPAAALGALYTIASDELATNSAIVTVRGSFCHLITHFDGRSRTDRVIDISSYGKVDPGTVGYNALLREVKATIGSASQRYQRNLEGLYLVGNTFRSQDLAASLGVSPQQVHLDRVVAKATEDSGLAAISAVFAQDQNAPLPLNNFRTREFSFSPELAHLFRGLKALAPFLVAMLITVVLALGAWFWTRERRIHELEIVVSDEIRRLAPETAATSAKPIDALSARILQMNKELEALGSPTSYSPLAVLWSGVTDLADAGEISLTSIKVRSAILEIQGAAPDYAAVEKLERLFKKNRNIYCKIKSSPVGTTYGSENLRGFKFEIELCE